MNDETQTEVTYESSLVKKLAEMTDYDECRKTLRDVYGTGAYLNFSETYQHWSVRVSL